MRQNPAALWSLVFIHIIGLSSLLAPLVSPYGAGGLDVAHILERPSLNHWMGTDGLGRDLFTRVLYGARVSLAVGIGTTFLALFIGTIVGLISGYARPLLDNLLMRIVDIFYGLPDLLVFILLSLILGRNIVGLLISLSLVTWVRFARLTRGEVLQAKELVYVEGARAVGASHPRILLRHILPNIMGPIIVTLTFMIPAVILAVENIHNLLMRIVDIFYGLPDLLVFILLSLILGRNIVGLLISLSLVTWVRFARLTRGEVLQAKELVYVEGARAVGASHPRILLRHILPNIMGPIIVTLTFMIPAVILAESTLSFIGLGINDPYSNWGTSWGTLAQDGWRAMRTYPHVIFFPGLAIFLTILSFNFLGNTLRDILDPKGNLR